MAKIRDICQNANSRFKHLTTLIFDMDNTLIPTRRGDLKTCNKIAELLHEDHEMPKSEAKTSTLTYLKLFRRCPENPSVSIDEWRMHLWSEALPTEYQSLTTVAYDYWLSLRYIYLKPPPEVYTLLRNLRQKYMMALITNGEAASQWEKIQNVNIEKYFDCVLVSGDLPWQKPDPEIFYSACNYLGVEPKQCAVIGDKLETDIEGGIQAHLGATIWIPLTVTPYGDRLEPQTKEFVPDLVIKNVLDLNEILLPGGGDGAAAGARDAEQDRAFTRPFRSFSTGHAKLANSDESGTPRSLDKSHRRVAMSLLSDLDSCSSSSSADFS